MSESSYEVQGQSLLPTPWNLDVVAGSCLFYISAGGFSKSLCVFFLTELMSCEELHSILHLVLQAGNIMNAVSKIQKN